MKQTRKQKQLNKIHRRELNLVKCVGSDMFLSQTKEMLVRSLRALDTLRMELNSFEQERISYKKKLENPDLTSKEIEFALHILTQKNKQYRKSIAARIKLAKGLVNYYQCTYDSIKYYRNYGKTQ